jgi:hypothetical protein
MTEDLFHVKQSGRHCERSEAIQYWGDPDWIASSQKLLAMTEDLFHVKQSGRHCERSEAIQRLGGSRLDCVVAKRSSQ